MQALAILFTGFSIFSALLIALTYFVSEVYQASFVVRLCGWGLLLVLSLIQYFHFSYFYFHSNDVFSVYYQIVLFCVAPLFYLFSQFLLKSYFIYRPSHALHFLPIFLVWFLPERAILSGAFVVGAIYLGLLAIDIYRLRQKRTRFKHELILLSGVFVIALAMAILGISWQWVSQSLFYTVYASAIGLAFLLTNIVLYRSPQLPVKVAEAVHDTYSKTTLGEIDCQKKLVELERLLANKKLYQQNNLDLQTLAIELGLSTHQLSELVNTQLGKGFSRLIREYRINAAQQMLLEESTASVLSVGIAVGFSSQSNFYDAFREITGMTPGRYRKLAKSLK